MVRLAAAHKQKNIKRFSGLLACLALVGLSVAPLSHTITIDAKQSETGAAYLEASTNLSEINSIPIVSTINTSDIPNIAFIAPQIEKTENIPPKPSNAPVYPPKPIKKQHPSCNNDSKLANNPKFIKLTLDIAEKWGVNQHLAYELVSFESGFNPQACNPTSQARGMMQFMPSTFRAHCKGDIFSAEDNLNCGMRLLSQGGLNHWTVSIPTRNHLVQVNAIPE